MIDLSVRSTPARLLLAATLLLTAAHDACAQELVMPSAPLPESCTSARDSIEPLRADLESAIPEALLAEARAHLGASAAQAEAWSDFAGAVLLLGDLELAAWAGVEAVRIDWNPELVGNTGAYLLHSGRNEARSWLLCARELGPRNAFVLEALAVSYERAGEADAARAAIDEARRADPEDPMIEIQHAFLTTGAPPPPARPPNGPAERCLADLTTQAERVHAGVQAQHEALDRVTGFESRVPAFEGMWESLYEPLLANVRAVLENEIPGAPEMQVNTAIAQCISVHLGFTEQLLNSVVRDSATTLTFWADALRISPAAFVRDIIAQDTTVRDSPVFSVNRLPSTAVDEWRRESDEEATLQWRRDIDVCNGISDLNAANACREAADVRECTTNIETFETWAARQSATYNTAALGFDRVAMELTRWVDGEVARAHDFAERHAAALVSGGSVGPGPDGRPMSQRDFTLQSINLAWQGFYNLNLVAGAGGVDDFIAEQARWFDNEKQFFEQVVASERESIESRCNPIIFRAELEALAREQWEAYRESLWDNVAANIEGEWDPTFDCEGSIGGFSVSLNDSGTAGLSAKWKNVEASIDSTGKRQLSGELNWGPIDFNARTTMDQNGLVSTSVGASGSVPVAPGVTAKGGISVVADGRRNEPALVFSGSLALGFERGGAGVSCSPGSGSLKVYPRAFTQAAVTYALTTR